MRWGWTVARARGRCGEPILVLREDGDSPPTALHSSASLASKKSGGGVSQGSGQLALEATRGDGGA
jgi:hypothetical protein